METRGSITWKDSSKSDVDSEDLKQQKQQYLIKEVIEKGYDKVAFCDFMQSLKREFLLTLHRQWNWHWRVVSRSSLDNRRGLQAQPCSDVHGETGRVEANLQWRELHLWRWGLAQHPLESRWPAVRKRWGLRRVGIAIYQLIGWGMKADQPPADYFPDAQRLDGQLVHEEDWDWAQQDRYGWHTSFCDWWLGQERRTFLLFLCYL